MKGQRIREMKEKEGTFQEENMREKRIVKETVIKKESIEGLEDHPPDQDQTLLRKEIDKVLARDHITNSHTLEEKKKEKEMEEEIVTMTVIVTEIAIETEIEDIKIRNDMVVQDKASHTIVIDHLQVLKEVERVMVITSL